MSLGQNGYRIKLHEAEVAKGELRPYELLAIDPGGVKGTLPGIPVTEPVFQMKALWVNNSRKNEAEKLGYTVVDPVSVLVTHLTETLRKYSAEVLTRQQTQLLLDQAKKTNPAVVDELTPNLLSLGETHRALQNLLKERVPIRSLPLILEAFADQARISKDVISISEAARRALSRVITAQHQGEDGVLEAHTLSPAWEQKLVASLHKTESGLAITLPPRDMHMLLEAIAETVKKRLPKGTVIICSTGLRHPLRKLLERSLPSLPVLSYEEIWPETQVKILGKIDEPQLSHV
jgi:flagellar biosynthesis protein FlhA